MKTESPTRKSVSPPFFIPIGNGLTQDEVVNAVLGRATARGKNLRGKMGCHHLRPPPPEYLPGGSGTGNPLARCRESSALTSQVESPASLRKSTSMPSKPLSARISNITIHAGEAFGVESQSGRRYSTLRRAPARPRHPPPR